MKEKFFRNVHIVMLLVWVLAGYCLAGCKKNSQPANTPYDSKFSFTYKGVRYILPYKDGSGEWDASDGIFINRPDIFPGVVEYRSENCAWMATGGAWHRNEIRLL